MVYPLLSVRCLSCNNIDSFPRLNFDSIPYCSQCTSTTNLVPEAAVEEQKTPQAAQAPTQVNELAALLQAQLSFTAENAGTGNAMPMTPPEVSPTAAGFGGFVSQHYNHSCHQAQQTQTDMDMEMETEQEQEQEPQRQGLAENCSSYDVLRASARDRERKDPVYGEREQWCNDYYGGVDANVVMEMEDEEAPCSFYGRGTRRLEPFAG